MKKLFDEIPRLEDERILLRQLQDADAEDLYRLSHDQMVYRYLPTFLIVQQYEDPGMVIRKLYTECLENKDSLILGIFRKEEPTAADKWFL